MQVFRNRVFSRIFDNKPDSAKNPVSWLGFDYAQPPMIRNSTNRNYRKQTHNRRHIQHYHRLILSPHSPA
ncbi:MAG: hypothetical protein QQW96_01870, partial [Tychonema bourrellyi B0820]|nr:hypothetical protein [Tychonema bourrellyi B0820]